MRALGLLLGVLVDRIIGDPRQGHPVAVFGNMAQALERRSYRDSVPAGARHLAALLGPSLAISALLSRWTSRRGPVTELLLTAVTTWAVLGGRSLKTEAQIVNHRLSRGDLPGARQRLTHLVGRDTRELDADEVARAVVESVAENTSDAVVAPLWWGAVAGVPGLIGYRIVNTLDAMVGHRNDRYERFGKASARLDDVANLIPARLAALLTVAAAPTVQGSTREALRTWRRDAGHHPSPNAGPVEAAFAGALGCRLGGVNTYGGSSEDRHELGSGRPARPEDIARSVRLADTVMLSAGLGCAALAHVVTRHRSPQPGGHFSAAAR